MPVRIYDIARRLGVENKAVIAKAKELGISGAKVPSSSLDKITAEFLEEQIRGEKPPPEANEKAVPPTPEPIVLVKEEAKDAEGKTEAVDDKKKKAKKKTAKKKSAESAPALEPVLVTPASEIDQPVESPKEAGDEPASEPEIQPIAAELPSETTEVLEPAPEEIVPPEPPGPKVGDKVGFIKLPARPTRGGAKAGAKPETAKGRQDGRGPGGRGQQQTGGREAARAERPAAPAKPRFTAPANGKIITFKPPIVVRDLAEKLNRKPYQLIADLIELKVMASVNQAIDEETAKLLCAKYGFRFEVEKRERGGGIVHSHIKKIERVQEDDKPEDLVDRAPVVTIMGHVDHGKTTLLDVIRKTNVVAGEAGGITQHIGAYTISVPHPDKKTALQQITFLDTPGHAAFSAMRARGANVTDIVILVVAANDGVKPQTIEALNHAQAAEVPIIVAVNKCDLPGANPMNARQQLQEHGLVPDDWGGETIFVDVSAINKKGIDRLLEMIVLQADLLELKANPKRPAKGNVIESGIAAGGPTASVLVRSGTLKVGSVILSGENWGRIRALSNEEGNRLKEAGPSVAVKVLGLNGAPEAGLEFNVVQDEKTAKTLIEERKEALQSEKKEQPTQATTLESLFNKVSESGPKELKVLVKGDTQGSVEAIVDALKNIESEKVNLKVIHHGVGTISETDVHLASASQAIILGFHTRIDNGVSDLAKHQGVQIKLYSIIYELIDEVKNAMAGLLDPDVKETVIGAAEIRKVFALSKGGHVAGCIVSSGRILRTKVRVLRQKNLLFEGPVQALRRFQDEVNEVRSGMECGIRLDGFNDFQEGDTIECFTTEKVAATL